MSELLVSRLHRRSPRGLPVMVCLYVDPLDDEHVVTITMECTWCGERLTERPLPLRLGELPQGAQHDAVDALATLDAGRVDAHECTLP